MAKKIGLAEVKKRLTAFARKFKDAADEQQLATIFWVEFYKCFGHTDADAAVYESKVKMLSGNLGRIDSFIPGLLLVEHKSKGKDLDAAYEQATDYYLRLADEVRPKYIVVSDFGRIRLYDLAKGTQHECKLSELASKASWFKFLIEGEEAEVLEETPINREAAYTVSKLHEALLRANFKGRDLEIFLTRLLFCLFADDTGVFGENNLMRKLVEGTRIDGTDLGARLTELFDVFNQPVTDRQSTLDDSLAVFPYVNGKLFEERTRIPAFDSDLRELLLSCVVLDWANISPAIFGAMFQAVLEMHEPDAKRQATRRELGAHYTSERNILRVIDPLFMDGLRDEFVKAGKQTAKLQALYDKLPTLKIFDPACGCGNFLVIAYRELRRLELDVIDALFNFQHGKGLLDVETLCKVNVGQFYGIEIDEAAAHIARVALYITDHQLNLEAAQRFGTTRATVPLISTPHIACNNALVLNWNEVLPATECSYVLGNPPFIGKQNQKEEQKADVLRVFAGVKSASDLDYVACWYKLAMDYIAGNGAIEVAFVSTNSITQGEQVAILWGCLLQAGIKVNFAHRTFKWSNEGKGNAAVHCVIIGFALQDRRHKYIWDYEDGKLSEPHLLNVSRINPYLVDGDAIIVQKRNSPVSKLSPISYGNKPTDKGNFLFTKDEMERFVEAEPTAKRYIKKFIGAEEFINGTERYCLWLCDAQPADLRSMPKVLERVANVRAFRLESTAKPTRDAAERPNEFFYISQPQSDYLVIPETSSENRIYIPIGYESKEVIASNALWVVPNATLFDFSVLNSSMHMAWVRAICGRLESRYRYTGSLIYNNLALPNEIDVNKLEAMNAAATQILDARKLYSEDNLATLYDVLTMPKELRQAHDENNRAVDAAYGYKGGKDDASRASFLFKLYEQATSLPPPTKPKKVKKT